LRLSCGVLQTAVNQNIRYLRLAAHETRLNLEKLDIDGHTGTQNVLLGPFSIYLTRKWDTLFWGPSKKRKKKEICNLLNSGSASEPIVPGPT
jgi:hypothetical protein